VIGIVAFVAVLVGVGTFILIGNVNVNGHKPAAQVTPGSPVTDAPGGPGGPGLPGSAAPSPTSSPTPDNTFKPAVPGWQVVVAAQSNGLSYDVPQGWKNNGRGVTIGLDDGSDVPKTIVSFSAEAKRGSCSLAGAGFSSSKVNDLNSSATQAARMWADSAAYKTSSPRKSIGTPQRIGLKRLSHAVQITARVSTAPQSDNCGQSGTSIHIVVLPVRTGGTLLFVVYAGTGQPGAISESDLSKIAGSVRLAK
jgi:hypothetical protein